MLQGLAHHPLFHTQGSELSILCDQMLSRYVHVNLGWDKLCHDIQNLLEVYKQLVHAWGFNIVKYYTVKKVYTEHDKYENTISVSTDTDTEDR